MQLNGKLKSDRSGLSTLIVIIVVIVVVAAAAVAAVVVLNNNGGEKEKKTLAVGTTIKYEVSLGGAKVGEIDCTYVGQSNDLYFIMETTEDDPDEAGYDVIPKKAPAGAKVSKVTIETKMDGRKTVDLWEYTIPVMLGITADVEVYINTSIGLAYKINMTILGSTMTEEAKAYTPKWQTSYEESEYIGMTYKYAAVVSGFTFNAHIVCVADCVENKFGVMYEFESIAALYALSDHSNGVPMGAEKSGTTTISTIDGPKEVEIWEILGDDGSSMVFHYDAETQIVYRITSADGTTSVVYNLTEKP